MLHRKHFTDLADRLRGLDVPPDVLDALAGFCRASNPLFDEKRWRAYLSGECGPRGGPVHRPAVAVAR